jgi:signal peptidase I
VSSPEHQGSHSLAGGKCRPGALRRSSGGAIAGLEQTGSGKARRVAEKKEEGLWGFIVVIVQALLIALVIRTFLFQPFNIPTGSLIPTLLVGDYLFVSKYSYGYTKYSFPFDAAPITGRIWSAQPKRGDIIVFRNELDGNKDYIKRLIGLPGDTVQMMRGRLYINGTLVEREDGGSFTTDRPFGEERQVPRYIEKLPGGTNHAIIEVNGDEGGLADNTAPMVVPPDHFFFMGDNRDSSQDSRFSNVGMVPFDKLIGRAEIIWFSIRWSCEEDGCMTRLQSIGDMVSAVWEGRIRWGRIFQPIR